MTNESNPHAEPEPNGTAPPAGRDVNHHESAPDHPAASGRGALVGVTVVLIAIVALAIYGIWKRHHSDEVLADTTRQLAAPAVIAVEPVHDGWVAGNEPAIVIEFDFEGDTANRVGMAAGHRHGK